MNSSCEHLIHPTTLQGFLDNFFDLKSLHVKQRPPSYYSGMFSTNDLEKLLWEHEEHIPYFVRVHQQGTDRTPMRGTTGLNLFRWVMSEYSAGATIIVNNLDRYSAPIAAYLRTIETTFKSPTSASAYLTPPSSQAFKVHFDTHDVFIAQVEGSKTYCLYETARIAELPLSCHQREVDVRNLPEPSSEIRLEAGDLLYIPRGIVHVANTTEFHSLHLSLGVHTVKVVDVVKTLLDIAADSEKDLRKACRSIVCSEPWPSVLNALIRVLREEYGLDIHENDVAATTLQRFVASLRALPDKAFVSTNLASITLDDLVARRKGAICAIRIEDKHAQLSFPGLDVSREEGRRPTVLQMPVTALDALVFVAQRSTPFRPRELPDFLTDNAKLVLTRRLIREGLLMHAT